MQYVSVSHYATIVYSLSLDPETLNTCKVKVSLDFVVIKALCCMDFFIAVIVLMVIIV